MVGQLIFIFIFIFILIVIVIVEGTSTGRKREERVSSRLAKKPNVATASVPSQQPVGGSTQKSTDEPWVLNPHEGPDPAEQHPQSGGEDLTGSCK